MDGVQLVGVIGLVAVLVLVAGFVILRRRFDGRLRAAVQPERSLAEVGIALPADNVAVVQFSGEFCAICTPARTLVQRVLRDHPDIARIEVDVAEHLTAVRALDIRRTPTLLIVDEQGQVVHRSSGMPREAELRQAVSGLAAHNR
ncbi:MAG: thioredoxin family protein [Geodermatophilaceae bacterium]|nr:thioredoxin family protein [Geodermatophilaceae bacterium]